MGYYHEPFEPPFFLWYKSKDRSIKKYRQVHDRPDEDIVADISRCLTELHHIDTSNVSVACNHNVVTLSGTCSDRKAGRFLWAIADNTLGVKYVLNKLKYKSDQTYQ